MSGHDPRALAESSFAARRAGDFDALRTPTVNRSRVEGGRLRRIRATFDPRPLLGARG